MINILDLKKCSGCHSCYNSCPVKCIEMIANDEGFLYPHIDKTKCLECGMCERVCPVVNEHSVNPKGTAYACVNKNTNIKINSSSSGIFTLLAENIIHKNGAVYGAAFDSDFNVRHICVTNADDLYKLRGSKYLQSTIGDIYADVKKKLDSGCPVLFTGTPCQISGLRFFLSKDYNNLYTQDIICHGSPSPKIWQKYLNFRRKNKQCITDVSFRNKKYGWEKYSLVVKRSDNSEYSSEFLNDLYMNSFLSNINLRLSCYDCKSKSHQRESDITLGDFWGVKNVAPDMYDSMGTSLVIINSDKGKLLFDEIKNDINYAQVDFDMSVKYNPSLHTSVSMPKGRSKFFDNADKYRFDVLVKKYMPDKSKYFIGKIKRMVKKLIKKFS